jgi:hypothetical protein
MNRSVLLLGAFAAGAGVMLAELTAPRALAPVFGASYRIWVAVIVSTMAAMGLGYWLGERGSATPQRFARWLLAMGLFTLPTAFLVKPLGHLFDPEPVPLAEWTQIDDGLGGALVVLAALFMPMACCAAAVAPMAGRLLVISGLPASVAAGRVIAVGTIGSLAGTLAPHGFLLDHFGVRITLLSAAGLPLLAALVAWRAAGHSAAGRKA